MFDLYITLRLLYLELRYGLCSVLRAPAKRTVGVVRMTVGGMRIGVGGVRMAAGGMRIGVGACEWLSEDANRCRCVRKAVDFEKRVVSVLRANQCWLGMRISVGTNANTHLGRKSTRKPKNVGFGKERFCGVAAL